MLSILVMQFCYAQPTRYGNEWIDYTPGHQYYKIKVINDGMYHIPFALLDSTIPNFTSINPADLVMYHNGTAVPIYVSATGPAMGASDFIEFYGKRNIGDVDSVLYPQPGLQPHIWYSLFSDTSIYFLTTKSGGNNFHYQTIANDTAAITSLTEDMYFWFSSHVYYTPFTGGKFSGGTPFNTGTDYLYKSIYDLGEAWGGGWINCGGGFNASLPTPGLYTGGPDATLNAWLFTRSYVLHNLVCTLNNNPIQTFSFNNSNGGFDHNQVNQTVPVSSLQGSNTFKVQETAGCGSGNDNLLMYSEILYPRKYDFGSTNSFLWKMQAGNGERFFRVASFATTSLPTLLYDITNGYIIPSTDPTGSFPKRFVLPAAAGDRELLIRTNDPASYTLISRMDTITFQDYSSPTMQGNYMVVANKILRKVSSGTDTVQMYADYRSQNLNGGNLSAHVYDIDQIMDQYGYGVRKSPLGLRNFVEYAYDHWTKKPEYLFIIGKGRDYKETREGSPAYDMNQVVPFGRYPSDNLLACRRGTSRPLVATGRLAARVPTDVINYLNKIKTYEQLQNAAGDPHQTKAEKLWMKQIMHFSGGSTSDEQVTYASYLNDFANIVRDTSWGANPYTIYKNVSTPVDNGEADLIRGRIDSGLSLMTFFGHAAGTTFDIAIDDPTNWKNYNKYPIIYSNGCQSGDVSSLSGVLSPTFSESVVLTPDKGAVAFTATAYLSVSTGLYNYGLSAYWGACAQNYNKPWGKALQSAQIAMDSLYSGDDYTMMVADEMTLHGDPAIKLNQYNLPDYQVDQTSLYFNPQTVNAGVDSFYANVIVTNLGKAIKDSIQVSLYRTYARSDNQGDTTITYKWKVKATYYIDTVSIKIPTFPSLNAGFGQNIFTVWLESENRIPELSETNNGGAPGQSNGLSFGLYIESDDVIPIYPYDYAIVPKQNITLKASTVDPFAKLKTYKIQLDTSELFRHPLAQTTITQTGGVLHWTVPITFHDSTVYYWRVSRDSIADTLSYRWHYSSFVYIKDEYPGWNQSHYFQYNHDNYGDNIYMDGKDRTFKFIPTGCQLHAVSGWADAVGHGPVIASNIAWDACNAVTQYRYRMGNCTGNGLGYANQYGNPIGGFTFGVLDTVTGQVWQSINQGGNYGQYGNIHCSVNNGPQGGFDFNVTNGGFPAQNGSWSRTIMSFLDSIPNGNIIVMYVVNKPDWANIDSNLINKLAAMGATGLKALYNGTHAPGSYIFFCMKGNSTISRQYMQVGYNQLDGYFNYGTLYNKGTYQSTLIGPANKWGSFHWRRRAKENPTSDHESVEIIGIQNNGAPVSLLTTQTPDTVINFINSAQYPYIRLKMHSEDDTTHTPTQLYYWRVLYDKVPEAAINPAAHFYINRDTVGLGDTLNIEVALENVTELPMDSMRTLYTIKQLPNGVSTSSLVKTDSLRAFQTQILKFKQQMSNTSLAGKDRLIIEANPEDALHQLEQYHFNNYAIVNFNTTSDKINPLLDVTFDGRRIMSNDLVSSKPDVLITMRDENQYLALNDTSLAQVYIRYPGQTVPTLINYDNNILTFYPATGNIAKRNQARIEYKPNFTQDGTYDLLIRDKDRSGNYSSNTTNRYEGTTVNGVYYDYKTSFNIITKSMITNVLNYPNPFSTRTQFVFTLTGSEIPDYMKIQIMTITGKVVKEIQRAELGNIHIGVNKTDYYWDGRDEYGDKLANGVYFYRVITKIEDKSVDHMSSTQYGQFFNNTNIDKYFKNGFGKLVIMR